MPQECAGLGALGIRVAWRMWVTSTIASGFNNFTMTLDQMRGFLNELCNFLMSWAFVTHRLHLQLLLPDGACEP